MDESCCVNVRPTSTVGVTVMSMIGNRCDISRGEQITNRIARFGRYQK